MYDRIGTGYARVRRPDSAVAARIAAALGDAARIVNVGAGTGSYEPAGDVVAVEPSAVMVAQRAASAPPVVRGVAEHLPFRAQSFDAAMAVLTLHHWPDPRGGLAEMRRVARRQVVITFDWDVHDAHWFIADYLPEIRDLTAGHLPLADVVRSLPGARVEQIAVAHDTSDGTLVAYWSRPTAYLDAAVRMGSSGLRLLPPEVVDRASSQLAADLESGDWHRRHADLLSLDEFDVGLRLVVT